MATSLGYTPPTPPDTSATDEVDDLVRALHESGLLRALAGGVRAYPQLLRHVLEAVDANTIRSLVAVSGALGELDPDQAERLAEGLRRARQASAEAASGDAEGPLKLFRRLTDPDTRRGIAAALAALAAIGSALPR